MSKQFEVQMSAVRSERALAHGAVSTFFRNTDENFSMTIGPALNGGSPYSAVVKHALLCFKHIDINMSHLKEIAHAIGVISVTKQSQLTCHYFH